jgi:hypothetical protein
MIPTRVFSVYFLGMAKKIYMYVYIEVYKLKNKF